MKEVFKELFEEATWQDIVGTFLFITVMFTAIALIENLL